MTRAFSSCLILTAVTAVLSGCGDLRHALGLEKSPPDEFAVTASAPLTIPPDYGLRPPHSGIAKPATPDPLGEARTAVFGVKADPMAGTNGQTLTPGEEALLSKAGATNVDPRIRQEIDAEIAEQVDASDSFIDSLMFWQEPAKKDAAEPVDAVAESKRLREGDDAPAAPTLERTSHEPVQGAS
jgi:hypothetical protein